MSADRSERGTSRAAVATPTPDAATAGARAVITCSDSAAHGVAADTSGPLAAELLADSGTRSPG